MSVGAAEVVPAGDIAGDLSFLEAGGEIAARSPGQVFWRRLRRDRVAMVSLGLAGITLAQADQSSSSSTTTTTTTTNSDQGATSDMKDAGHATKRAAKKTGHKVKHTTKKVTHKAARKTREGAEKVEDKTQTPPQ